MLNLSSVLTGFHPRGARVKERFDDIVDNGILDYQNFVDSIHAIQSAVAHAVRDLRNEETHCANKLDQAERKPCRYVLALTSRRKKAKATAGQLSYDNMGPGQVRMVE